MLGLLLSSCAHRITAPAPSLDSALASWDWSRRTEAEFWERYPQYWTVYTQQVEALDGNS